MKRVAVTGGAGFIGSHVCARLLQDNCEVIRVDNFYTGRKANIAHLIFHRAVPEGGDLTIHGDGNQTQSFCYDHP